MQAYLFKAEMESEGKNAYVLDEHTPFIYGPIAASHVRVLVSEEEETEIVEIEDGLLSRACGFVWLVFKISVITIIVLEFLSKPGAYFVLGIVLACCMLAFLVVAIPLGVMSYSFVMKMKGTWVFTALALILAAIEFIT